MKTSKNKNENVNVANATSEELKWHTCSITGKRYQGYGNNAWPFFGRCCDEANLDYVIPARLGGTKPENILAYGGNAGYAEAMRKAGLVGFGIR